MNMMMKNDEITVDLKFLLPINDHHTQCNRDVKYYTTAFIINTSYVAHSYKTRQST